MKKVLIIGANGKIGRILSDKLKESSDFEPVAFLRKEEQKEYFDNKGIESRVGSLESEKDDLAGHFKGIDAVVFTAGSGPSTGYDKTLSVDLDGAVKTIDLAEQENVRRFVMVSAMNVGNKSAWEGNDIKPYYIAKHYADRFLQSSDLDYTIIRPGRLNDEDGSGKITTKNPQNQDGVTREDVAMVILESLKNENSVRQIIEFNNGETPVAQAVEEITIGQHTDTGLII